MYETGLFHRAISQSGTGDCRWAVATPGSARKKATKVAELLACPSKDSKQLVECLRTKDAIELIATDRSFQVSEIILSHAALGDSVLLGGEKESLYDDVR